jgi:hypothetical protein
MLMTKRLLKFEFMGIIFTVIVGTILHFIFAWTGSWPPVGVFAAVNESVWEHLKLAFWPSLAWAVFEALQMKELRGRFWGGKAFGIILMPLIIATIFYMYTSFTRHPILPIDIATFIVAVTAGYLLGYWLIAASARARRTATVAGVTAMVMLALSFGLFTFKPPHIGIFMDTAGGRYGILK